MFPGFHGWRRARAAAEAGDWAGVCGGHHHGRSWQDRHHEGHEAHGDDGLGSAFGVRRPLRFMAFKLDLDEAQVSELAAILNDLKTERAQAAVDQQRTISAFAEAVQADAFDASRAQDGLKLRVESAERLRDAVLKALARTHAMLNPEQRKRLAYLLRSGTLTI